SEDEAWDQILPAARRLQQTFSSWQEMGWNFIVGREFWAPQDEYNAATEYAYYELLTRPESPWRRYRWDLALGAGAPDARADDTSAMLTIIARPRGLTCLAVDVIDRGGLTPGRLRRPWSSRSAASCES